MIKKTNLSNFKSHKNTDILLGNLSVFCGANGVGKSSIIQILLLLREAFLKDKTFDLLDLKSDPVKIGNVNDAIYEFGDFEGFKIELDFTDNYSCNFYYEANSENEKEKSFIKLNKEKTIINDKFDPNNQHLTISNFSNISLFNENFQYVSAARKGPQESYSKDSKIVDVHKQISVIEGMAEYFVHFLDTYRNIDVIRELCTSGNNLYTDLYTQVSHWEKYIFNGANAELQDVGKLGYVLKYSFDNEKSTIKKTKSFDAKNVGFGLTYTLPILVAILSAKPGSLIIIENPEAHLHPSGIAKLTELMCIAAQAGIQIIIETHSDHVINGILVQSKKHETNNEFGINKENVSIYQFERNEKLHCSIATKIDIEDGGRIRFAPEGFFDQDEKDTDFLFDL